MDEKTRKGLETLLGKKIFEALEGKLDPLNTLAAIGKAEGEWKRITKMLLDATSRCRESQATILSRIVECEN